MRSLVRRLLPRTFRRACVGSAVVHAALLGALWNWQPKKGNPVRTQHALRVRLVHLPPRIAQAAQQKPQRSSQPPSVPRPEVKPEPRPEPPRRKRVEPPKRKTRAQIIWRRPSLPEVKAPTFVTPKPPPPSAEPPTAQAPKSAPPVELPKPPPPEVAPPEPAALPPPPPREPSWMTAALDQFWHQRRNQQLSRERAIALWESTRSYTDAEAGNIVARFGTVTVTRKQVEDAHEQLFGVKIKDLDLTPEQAHQRIKAVVGYLLLPEIEVAEAERRNYATRPGIEMNTWLTAGVSAEEIQDYYDKHKEVFAGKSLAEAWPEIENLILQSRLVQQQQQLERNLKEIRATADIVKHYELLRQPDAPDDAVLFSVNGQPYTLKQWRAELATVSRPPRSVADQEKYADRLIDRIILLSSTKGISDEAARRRLEAQRRDNLRRLLHHEEVEAKVHLTEAERRAYYAQRKNSLTVAGRMEVGWLELSFPPGDEKSAAAARTRLAAIRREIVAKKDFDAVADETAGNNHDVLVVKGGQWYVLSPLNLFAEGLPAAVKLLPAGATSEPLVYPRDGKGYLFHVYKKERARPMTFAEAKPFIDSELFDAKCRQREEAFQRELLSTADVQYDEATVADMVRRAVGARQQTVRSSEEQSALRAKG